MLKTNDKSQLAIEIIANLVNFKNKMYDLVLKPAGIENDLFAELLNTRKPDGKKLSKREMAVELFDKIDNNHLKEKVIRSLIETAAHWDRFELSHNEYIARATVQKAREVLNIIEIKEVAETEELNKQKIQEQELRKQEKEKTKNLELLLMMYDEIARMDNNPQERGYHLEDLINRLFQLYDIALLEGFRRNKGGEQIDGAIKLDGWHYIVEMKWTSQLTDMSQLDSLYGKVSRSGKQTMGLFISINGWSSNVIPLMQQHPDKSIILINGYDLRFVLTGEISLIDLLQKKITEFNLKGLPFLSVRSLI